VIFHLCIAQQILARLRFHNQDRGNLLYPGTGGNNRKGRFRQMLLAFLYVFPLYPTPIGMEQVLVKF